MSLGQQAPVLRVFDPWLVAQYGDKPIAQQPKRHVPDSRVELLRSHAGTAQQS
jgi:hypothetical protein